MYQEDEKDFIVDSEGELHLEDENMSWDDVLDISDNEGDVVSIKNKGEENNSASSKLDDETVIDLGDDLELVQDEPEEDVDDETLKQILNENQEPSRQKAFDAFGSEKSQDEEDFDLNEQLQSTNIDSSNMQSAKDASNAQFARKNEIGIKKQKSGVSPLLIAVLFFLVVIAGVYYYITFFAQDEFAFGQPQTKQNMQEEINNISADEIAKRNEDKIDVVNEEDISDIKPDENKEEKQEEKKDVLTIIPTGRVNPFLPTPKYIQKPEKLISYDKVNIPKPPKEYGVQNETIDKMLTIAVSGIMYDEQKPSAIITFDNNDYFVQKGDRLDNYRVVDINRNSVLIAYGKDIYRANVGEEFRISSKFEGNAQFLNSKDGGGRQYYSVNSLTEESKNSKQSTVPNYVSENEIEIKAK